MNVAYSAYPASDGTENSGEISGMEIPREAIFKGTLLGPESILDLMSAFDSFHPFIKSWVGPLIFVIGETPLAGYSVLSFPGAAYITAPIKEWSR